MNAMPRFLSVAWLREQYLTRRLTPVDVVAEIIKRSQADERFNIWITPPSEELVTSFLEKLKLRDIESMPLWGMPFAVKDNIDLANVPTTAGCPEYQYVPTESAVVVAKLVAAGAVPVGKTNMDQFATGLVGTRSPYGETHNALREELISGGSSSGSAVAVARGQAAFALGTDTAGSGRVPAGLNNIYGFKPSCGAWSVKGVVPACLSLDCVSVFANSLNDCLQVDRVVRGYEAGDPWSKKIPVPRTELPRVLYLPDQKPEFFGPYAAEYAAAWERAERKLLNMGVAVRRIDYGLFAKAAAILYEGPWIAERWADLGEFVATRPETVHAVTATILRSGANLDAAALFKSIHQVRVFRAETRQLMEDAILVMPTSGGSWSREAVKQNPLDTNQAMGRYTNHCNVLDLCAVSIPAGFAAAGVPFGITLFALSGREGLLTAVAEQFPSATSLIAVCGLHMRDFPLEYQMHQYGARFIREAATAPCYRMVKIPAETEKPAKPGLIKRRQGGASLQLEIWEMPNEQLGYFMNEIPAPLGIGRVDLLDGSSVLGFVCEEYIAGTAEDITGFGGWRAVSD
jgi:allophanate hydrolase